MMNDSQETMMSAVTQSTDFTKKPNWTIDDIRLWTEQNQLIKPSHRQTDKSVWTIGNYVLKCDPLDNTKPDGCYDTWAIWLNCNNNNNNAFVCSRGGNHKSPSNLWNHFHHVHTSKQLKINVLQISQRQVLRNIFSKCFGFLSNSKQKTSQVVTKNFQS